MKCIQNVVIVLTVITVLLFETPILYTYNPGTDIIISYNG